MRRAADRPARVAAAALAAVLALCAAASPFQERFRRTAPPPNPLEQLRLPTVETYRISNGLLLGFARVPDAPLVSIHLVVLAGEADDPPALPGLAEFTARMIVRGTALLSADDVERQLEALGAELSISVSPDHTVFSLNLLAENLDPALEILSQLVRFPAFQGQDADAVRRTMRYDLLARERDPEFVARRELGRQVFASHPYRMAYYGDDVARALNGRDAGAFFKKYYRPNNAIFVCAGDFVFQSITRRVSRIFNTWPSVPVERAPLPPLEPGDREKVCFVEVPQTANAVVAVGNVAPALSWPDAFPFMVLNQLLGGTATSRLLLNLREDKQYAYYALSRADYHRAAGIFVADALVKPSAVHAATMEILKEMRSLAAEKADSLEVEQAKSLLIGAFPLSLEPLTRFSAQAALLPTLGLGDALWNGYYDNVMMVNPENVMEAARRYFRPRPVVVIAGSADRVAEHLREFDRVEVYDVRGNLQQVIQKGAAR